MDRRVQKTKHAIADAYYDLFLNGKYKKITISEIARKANIDRKTFYLHYDSVEDIVQEFIDQRVKDMLDILVEKIWFDGPVNVEEVVVTFNERLTNDLPLYKKIASNPSYQNFWRMLEISLAETIVAYYSPIAVIPVSTLNIYTRFYFHGLISIYVDWLRGELDITLEEFTQSVSEIVRLGIEEFNTHINKI